MTAVTDKEDWMTSQLNYLIAKQRKAELVSRAEQARLTSEARSPRSASVPRRDRTQASGRFPSVGPARLRECT